MLSKVFGFAGSLGLCVSGCLCSVWYCGSDGLVLLAVVADFVVPLPV